MEFGRHGKREVVASFDGGTMSSDGGAPLLREVDRLSQCFRDERNALLVRHRLHELLAQRVYALALGYEDLNDHEQLRFDPLLGVMAGKLEAGKEARQARAR